jgi:hypothetical protein
MASPFLWKKYVFYTLSGVFRIFRITPYIRHKTSYTNVNPHFKRNLIIEKTF